MSLDRSEIDNLIRQFLKSGGEVTRIPEGVSARRDFEGEIVEVHALLDSKDKAVEYVFTIECDTGERIKVACKSKWADLVQEGERYSFSCNINDSNHTADLAGLRFSKIPTQLNHSKDPSCGQKSRSTQASAFCRLSR